MRLGWSVAPICAWLGACGDGGRGSEAHDAALDAVCALPPGQTYITATAHILPPDQGFDIDGDSSIDNAIGALPEAVRAQASAGLDEAIATGQLLIAIFLVDWDPPTANDPDVKLSAFAVVDADIPADPSNNLDGRGRFYAPIDTLDLSCRLIAPLADLTTLVDGVLTASGIFWRFLLTTGTGRFELKDVTYVAQLSADFATGTARLGGTMTMCSLSAFPFPGDTPGSVLDTFVNDPTIAQVVQADMDVDGDGLERVEGDGVSVLRCIDGDGITVIDGPACPCHPAIVDGYTIGLEFQLVKAELVGVL